MTLPTLLLTPWDGKCLQPPLFCLHGCFGFEPRYSCFYRIIPEPRLDSKRNENILGFPKFSVTLSCASLYKMEMPGQMGPLQISAPFLELEEAVGFQHWEEMSQLPCVSSSSCTQRTNSQEVNCASRCYIRVALAKRQLVWAFPPSYGSRLHFAQLSWQIR